MESKSISNKANCCSWNSMETARATFVIFAEKKEVGKAKHAVILLELDHNGTTKENMP